MRKPCLEINLCAFDFFFHSLRGKSKLSTFFIADKCKDNSQEMCLYNSGIPKCHKNSAKP